MNWPGRFRNSSAPPITGKDTAPTRTYFLREFVGGPPLSHVDSDATGDNTGEASVRQVSKATTIHIETPEVAARYKTRYQEKRI